MVTGPPVVFMLEHLKRNGSEVKPENIICAPCSAVSSGGFLPKAGVVVVCQDGIMHQQHMEDTLNHELVHMYDHVKFKVDWDNLRHHACSEVCGPCPTACKNLLVTLNSSDPCQQPEWRL